MREKEKGKEVKVLIKGERKEGEIEKKWVGLEDF